MVVSDGMQTKQRLAISNKDLKPSAFDSEISSCLCLCLRYCIHMIFRFSRDVYVLTAVSYASSAAVLYSDVPDGDLVSSNSRLKRIVKEA